MGRREHDGVSAQPLTALLGRRTFVFTEGERRGPRQTKRSSADGPKVGRWTRGSDRGKKCLKGGWGLFAVGE